MHRQQREWIVFSFTQVLVRIMVHSRLPSNQKRPTHLKFNHLRKRIIHKKGPHHSDFLCQNCPSGHVDAGKAPRLHLMFNWIAWCPCCLIHILPILMISAIQWTIEKPPVWMIHYTNLRPYVSKDEHRHHGVSMFVFGKGKSFLPKFIGILG